MKKKIDLSSLLLLIGIIFAFGAGFLIIKAQEYYNNLVPVIYCYEKDLPPYTVIKDTNLVIKKVPKLVVEQNGLFVKREDVIGKACVTIIPANTPINKSQIISLERNNSLLAANLTKIGDLNKVAYTIQTNPMSAVGGKILPNDMVHIIGTFRMPSSTGTGGDKTVSKIIVPFARVLDTIGKDGTLAGLTFVLTPQQVLDIEYVLKNGKITFALLPYEYNTVVENDVTTDENFRTRQFKSGGNTQ